MTDYEGEQAMEIEALEAIFMDDLQEYTGSLPFGWAAVGKTYTITINPLEEGEEADGQTNEELQLELLFGHTAQYPDQAPVLLVQSVYGLTDAEIARCTAELQQQVESNLGMAMIYTLISTAKEWLRNRAAQTAEEDPAIAQKKAIAEEEAKRVAARLHGTTVTVESFREWKAKYDAELAAEKAKTVEAADVDRSKRISGKAYFMQDRIEVATEAGALSEDDEEDFDIEEGDEGVEDDDDEEGEGEEDEDYEDDDDEGMLDEL